MRQKNEIEVNVNNEEQRAKLMILPNDVINIDLLLQSSVSLFYLRRIQIFMTYTKLLFWNP